MGEVAELGSRSSPGSRRIFKICIPNVAHELLFGLLPVPLVANGHSFYVQQLQVRTSCISPCASPAPPLHPPLRLPCISPAPTPAPPLQLQSGIWPLAVHATYQFGDEADCAFGKRERMREWGLWLADDAEAGGGAGCGGGSGAGSGGGDASAGPHPALQEQFLVLTDDDVPLPPAASWVGESDPHVPSLYLPCTFPVPSLYLPCTFPVGGRERPAREGAAARGAPASVPGEARVGRRPLARAQPDGGAPAVLVLLRQVLGEALAVHCRAAGHTYTAAAIPVPNGPRATHRAMARARGREAEAGRAMCAAAPCGRASRAGDAVRRDCISEVVSPRLYLRSCNGGLRRGLTRDGGHLPLQVPQHHLPNMAGTARTRGFAAHRPIPDSPPSPPPSCHPPPRPLRPRPPRWMAPRSYAGSLCSCGLAARRSSCGTRCRPSSRSAGSSTRLCSRSR